MNDEQKFAEECAKQEFLSVKFVRMEVYGKNGESLGRKNHFELNGEVCPLPRGPLSQ